MLIWANSGRLRAAARNPSILFAKRSVSPPERSSRTKLMSPEVPAPGIAGGEKAKATASGSPVNCRFSRALISW